MKRLKLLEVALVVLAFGPTPGCVVEDDHRDRERREHREEEHHERRCPRCGAIIEVDARVCGSCHVSLR